MCVSFSTNNRVLECVTRGQTRTHAHTALAGYAHNDHTRHSSSPHTHSSGPHLSSGPHTHSSGPYTHSSVRSCKTEASFKRLLLPCCCPLQWWNKNADMWVFRCLARVYLRGKQPRDYLPYYPTSNAQSTESARDPNLRRGMQAGPLRAPHPSAREKIHGRRRKACKCKKSTLVHSDM